MIKFEETKVWGFKHALRGMRNPKESWERSDSLSRDLQTYLKRNMDSVYNEDELIKLGDADKALAQTLIKAGSEHRKFMRQIFVSVDITAPIFFLKELDTYKIGTTRNSTSTMHKICSKPITPDLFSFTEKYFPDAIEYDEYNTAITYNDVITRTCKTLESLRNKYLETKNKKYWRMLIELLPESWLYKSTFTMNYENLLTMRGQRFSHTLTEWSGKDSPEEANFMKWMDSLPFADELLKICDEFYKKPDFNQAIILICGKSGVGKTTIADELAKKYKLKVLKSYTTRQPRNESDDSHTYVDAAQFAELRKDMVAISSRDNELYGATNAQVDENHIYVIDYDGIQMFKQYYTGNKKVFIFNIFADNDTVVKRIMNRSDDKEKMFVRALNDAQKQNNLPVLELCNAAFSNNDGELAQCVNNIYNYVVSNIK